MSAYFSIFFYLFYYLFEFVQLVSIFSSLISLCYCRSDPKPFGCRWLHPVINSWTHFFRKNKIKINCTYCSIYFLYSPSKPKINSPQYKKKGGLILTRTLFHGDELYFLLEYVSEEGGRGRSGSMLCLWELPGDQDEAHVGRGCLPATGSLVCPRKLFMMMYRPCCSQLLSVSKGRCRQDGGRRAGTGCILLQDALTPSR